MGGGLDEEGCRSRHKRIKAAAIVTLLLVIKKLDNLFGNKIKYNRGQILGRVIYRGNAITFIVRDELNV